VYLLGESARVEAVGTIISACTSGHDANCDWVEFCKTDGGVKTCDPDWLKALATRCDTDGAACNRLVTVYRSLGDDTAELAWRQQATARLDAECAAATHSAVTRCGTAISSMIAVAIWFARARS
jgi:hypothetical protein